MDLCEVTENTTRHPWERARLKALRNIIRRAITLNRDLRILDVGCGDGFVISNLFDGISVKNINGVDLNLSIRQIEELSSRATNISYHNTFDNIRDQSFGLILLLDVVEHVEDDNSFLCNIVENYLDDDGYLMLTAPAYQFLFSSHDTFLGHYRRYTLTDLIGLSDSVGLKMIDSGYLFFSLIPLRFAFLCYERFFAAEGIENRGIGAWKYGTIITKTIELILTTENNISIALSRFGIRIPGLTVWALCRKPQL